MSVLCAYRDVPLLQLFSRSHSGGPSVSDNSSLTRRVAGATLVVAVISVASKFVGMQTKSDLKSAIDTLLG